MDSCIVAECSIDARGSSRMMNSQARLILDFERTAVVWINAAIAIVKKVPVVVYVVAVELSNRFTEAVSRIVGAIGALLKHYTGLAQALMQCCLLFTHQG